MTVDDVLGLMPIVAHRGWRLLYGNAIRDRDGYCPLCALADELGLANFKTSVPPAAAALGIPIKLAFVIADSADYVPMANDRPALMHALGMTHE